MFSKVRPAAAGIILGAALLLAPMARGVTPSAQRADWPVHGGTWAEQRYSPLAQVNTANAAKLKLAAWLEFDTSRGQEATPIVVDGVMYVSTAWSKVYALDAVTGRKLWYHDPEVPGRKGFDGCCDVGNRGVAVTGGRVFVGAFDGRLQALDAKTGKLIWSVQTTDTAKPYTITGAPRVFDNKVVIGNGGAEFGVRGYVTAYDQATGKKLWRFYTVPGDPSKGPDGEVSDPILAKAALPTWFGKWYVYGGGGTVWDSIVYDPEMHSLYIGVGNGSPWNRQVRSDGKGDNLFLSSIVALDPDTGAYKWHYQETPGESWDFTATQQIMLATLKIDGQDRKVLMHAPKNGFFYVLDRSDGKLLSAKNFVPMNWATGVDMATGRPIENPDARYQHGMFLMHPSALGGHSWHAMAYSPQTGLVYIPAQSFSMPYANDPKFEYKPGNENMGTDQAMMQPPDDPDELKKAVATNGARLLAWNPVAQKPAWSVERDGVQNGGVLATAGGLVFQGTGSGHFEARRADTGKLLWSFPTQSGVIAAPISYQVKGVQYVAVLAGYGGAYGIGVAADEAKVRPNGRVLIFKLGGGAKLPPVRGSLAPPTIVAESFTKAQVDSGRFVFTDQCGRCHGHGAQSAGVLPDLRRSAALSDPALWRSIVLDGALESAGMRGLKQWVSPEQAESVRAYVSLKAKILAAHDAKAKVAKP